MALFRTLSQLRPIISALSRHKVATALIVLQVALTLAVASNALFIVATRIVHLSRPTGTDEAHIFVIRNGWHLGQTLEQIDANIRTDVDSLRRVPGVRDAYSSNDYPLCAAVEGETSTQGEQSTRVKLTPDQSTRPLFGMVFAVDEHALNTLDVPLIAGRNFRPEEMFSFGDNDKMKASSIIVSRSLADKLFPDGSALGRTVYLTNGPAAIVGIIAHLQGPLSMTPSSDGDTVLVPARYVDPEGVAYVVRTDGVDMETVIAAALHALQKRSGSRIIDAKDGVVTMTRARERAYAEDRSVAILMSIVCALLLLATAGGIVGLSSFWVGQRRKQIGIRRSLGATRGDILRYFHAENFLIVGGGVVLGIVLAILTNLGLMTLFYPLQHMPLYVPLLGAMLLWLLGQLAVWGPARYAAKVAPVTAIRTS